MWSRVNFSSVSKGRLRKDHEDNLNIEFEVNLSVSLVSSHANCSTFYHPLVFITAKAFGYVQQMKIPLKSQVFPRTSVVLLRLSDKIQSLTFIPLTLSPTSSLSSGYWNRHDLWRDVVYLMLNVETEVRRPNMGQDHARNAHPLISGLPATTEVVVDTDKKRLQKVQTQNKRRRLDC